jgi:hypothetical protein
MKGILILLCSMGTGIATFAFIARKYGSDCIP